MILNAIDEVLFWDEIELLKDSVTDRMKKYYPHDYNGSYESYKAFLKSHIPDKSAFIKRLEHYAAHGTPTWIAGRSQTCDDIDRASMVKALTISSKESNGEEKALRASRIQDSNADLYSYFTDNILFSDSNCVLELTIGAGGGTNAVMKKMKSTDYYMGVDIDFVCAKNADAIAKYYGVNGLGIATSLWSLPFDNDIFTVVYSRCGLGECREIPTILKEAVRVLEIGGRIVLQCENPNKAQRREIFDLYGFSAEERTSWLRKVRMYADYEQLKELLLDGGMKLINAYDNNEVILVFEK